MSLVKTPENHSAVEWKGRKEITKFLFKAKQFNDLTPIQREWIIVQHEAPIDMDKEQLRGILAQRLQRESISWEEIGAECFSDKYLNASLRTAGSYLAGNTLKVAKRLVHIAVNAERDDSAIKAAAVIFKALGWTSERSENKPIDNSPQKSAIEQLADEELIKRAGLDPNEVKVKDEAIEEMEEKG